MSMDPVSFAGDRLRLFGLTSGLDIDAIVENLMKAERVPLDRLEQRRQLLAWTKEEYLGINASLDALRQKLTSLKLSSTFQVRTAVSSNEGVATATAGAGAAEGVYELNVTQLAEGIQLASSGSITRSVPADRSSLWAQFGIDPAVDSTLSLTLEVSGSGGTRSATLTFSHANGDDINDVVAAINNAGLGLTAAYDQTLDRLFVSSRETGASVTLTVTDDTVTLNGGGQAAVWAELLKLPTSAAGQDATFSLNGATGLAEPSNQFTIAGVTYNLKSQGTTTVTVSQDTDAIIGAITSFVDEYNAVVASLNGEIGEKRLYDYPPLTDAQKLEMDKAEIDAWQKKARQGLLQGDSLLLDVLSQMRTDVPSRVDGTGSTYRTLSSIGITTGLYSEGGKLYVDEAKLRQALTADPEGVAALFTSSGGTWDTQGVAVRLSSTLDSAIERIRTRAGLSGAEIDSSGLGRQISLVDEQIARMEDRLTQVEERYYRQFTLMEQVLSQMSTQAMWLSQQFSGG